MQDLFDKKQESGEVKEHQPLAERMRPRTFDEFLGQEKLMGEDSPLRLAIENDNLNSLILWGPPGSGKTTLAKIIANKTESKFHSFSAVISGIKEVRETIKEAKKRKKFNNRKTIVFIDEIHRFNKAQQDALLPYVEDGTIILIGATTENPSFEVISPLLSRSIVYKLEPLSRENLKTIFKNTLKDKKRGLGEKDLKITDDALDKIVNYCDGDARVGLNILENTANYLGNKGEKKIDKEKLEKVLEHHALRYDKKGEEHYNLISAFIKSMRDSDPNGALYWLARMIESGEDPRFIARRMIIFASEDIGNEDPQAIQVAVAVSRALEHVGLPEARINLAQGVTYLATAPKGNKSYKAIEKALKDAKKGSYGVPLHLRNAVTSLMENFDYGKDYKYAHNEKGKPDQTHFPEELGEQIYYKEDNE